MNRRLVPLFLLAVFIGTTIAPRLCAEDATDAELEAALKEESQPRSVRPRTASRQPSSTNYVISRGEGNRPPAARDKFDVRFGAAAGVSGNATTTTGPGIFNLALNATIDARAWKYFGAEADVHGDLIGAKYYGNGSNNASLPTEKVSRDYLFALKGQYPFWLGHSRVTPKLGGGYGYIATDYTNPLSTAAATSTTTTSSTQTSQVTEVAGFFGLLGVDVEVTREIVLFADFAQALASTGTVTFNGGQAAALTGTGFNRLRAGGYYRLGQNWGLGSVFVRRSATYDTLTSGTGNSGDTQIQFLGMLMFEL